MNLLKECGRRIVLADGATGTELQRAGLPIGSSGESWNLDRPDRIERVHRAYIDAGSELILSNSFGANRWRLTGSPLAARIDDINHAAVTIARHAAASRALVFGDIGPIGRRLAPRGSVTAADLRGGCIQQATALLAAGADGIVIETMTALDEAVVCVEAARRAGAPVVIVSLAFEGGRGQVARGSAQSARTARRRASRPRGEDAQPRLADGADARTAAAALAGAGADILGANCGRRMAAADFVHVVEAFRSAAPTRPIMVRPNAGQPVTRDGAVVYLVTPQAFLEEMRTISAAGVTIVGGCCGTRPDHIAALRDWTAARPSTGSGRAASRRL